MSWQVTCPQCGHTGDSTKDFEMSLCDECYCPKCNERFEIDTGGDEEE